MTWINKVCMNCKREYADLEDNGEKHECSAKIV